MLSSLCINRIAGKSKFQISNYEFAKLQNCRMLKRILLYRMQNVGRMHFVICFGSITVKRCRHVSLSLSPSSAPIPPPHLSLCLSLSLCVLLQWKIIKSLSFCMQVCNWQPTRLPHCYTMHR